MRFFALLWTSVAGTGVGLGIDDLIGNWNHATSWFILAHGVGIAFLLMAPFFMNALVGLNEALRLYSAATSALAHINAAKNATAESSRQNYPRGH